MRSRIYSSKFYPPEYFSLIISAPNDIFYDLETSNSERVACLKARDEIKKRINSGQHVFATFTDSGEILPKQSKVSTVKLINDGTKFESILKDESEPIERIYTTRRRKTTIFSIVYDNGDRRDVEVMNGSYLFRLLMSQCRKF